MGVNHVQTVGDFVCAFSHPLVPMNGVPGTQCILKGFKLEDVFIQSAQAVENSKLVPLVNGDTVTLTNAIKAGRLTINAIRVSDKMEDGDMPLIATYLQGLADNLGGLMRISFGFNGAQESILFTGVTLVSCPPIILAGNDLPPYPVVWNYGSFIRGA